MAPDNTLKELCLIRLHIPLVLRCHPTWCEACHHPCIIISKKQQFCERHNPAELLKAASMHLAGSPMEKAVQAHCKHLLAQAACNSSCSHLVANCITVCRHAHLLPKDSNC
jgi:hypothetical protein